MKEIYKFNTKFGSSTMFSAVVASSTDEAVEKALRNCFLISPVTTLIGVEALPVKDDGDKSTK